MTAIKLEKTSEVSKFPKTQGDRLFFCINRLIIYVQFDFIKNYKINYYLCLLLNPNLKKSTNLEI